MTLAGFEFDQQIGQRLGFRYHQHLAHDVPHFQPAGPGDRASRRGAIHAIAQPAHQVLGVQHSDNVLRPALRIVNRNSRVLLVDDTLQRFLERQIAGHGKDIRPGNHDLAHGNVLQIEGAQDQLSFRRAQYPQSAAGGDDQLQLFRRVHAGLADLSHAEGFQHDARGGRHERQKRRGQRHEEIHRPGNGQRNALRPLQRNRLGNHFSQDDDHVGHQHKGQNNSDRMRVKVRVRQAGKQRLDHVSDRGFADPAECEAGDGDAELHGIEDVIELLVEFLDGAGADALRRDHLLHARLAHAHQGKFGGDEERVCRDRQDHRYDAEDNEGNHPVGDLSIAFLRLWHLERA